MPDFEILYPGRFLQGKVIDRPRVIRIVSVAGTELEGDDGKKAKCVVKYRANFKIESGKLIDGQQSTGEIVWAKTNAALLAAALDERDYEKWPGHLVTIHFDPTVKFGADTPGGLRVYGSPEMKAAKTVEIKRPRRKKPEVYRLVPTDNQGRDRVSGKPPQTDGGEIVPPPTDDDQPGA